MQIKLNDIIIVPLLKTKNKFRYADTNSLNI